MQVDIEYDEVVVNLKVIASITVNAKLYTNNFKKSKLFYKSNNFVLSKGQIFLSDYDYFYKNSIQSFSNNTNELKDTKILKEDPSRFIIFAIDN